MWQHSLRVNANRKRCPDLKFVFYSVGTSFKGDTRNVSILCTYRKMQRELLLYLGNSWMDVGIQQRDRNNILVVT